MELPCALALETMDAWETIPQAASEMAVGLPLQLALCSYRLAALQCPCLPGHGTRVQCWTMGQPCVLDVDSLVGLVVMAHATLEMASAHLHSLAL